MDNICFSDCLQKEFLMIKLLLASVCSLKCFDRSSIDKQMSIYYKELTRLPQYNREMEIPTSIPALHSPKEKKILHYITVQHLPPTSMTKSKTVGITNPIILFSSRDECNDLIYTQVLFTTSISILSNFW